MLVDSISESLLIMRPIYVSTSVPSVMMYKVPLSWLTGDDTPYSVLRYPEVQGVIPGVYQGVAPSGQPFGLPGALAQALLSPL